MMNRIAPLLLSVALLASCAPPDAEGPVLSGVLDLRSGSLAVTAAAESTVLGSLQALQRDTLNSYIGLLGRDTIAFSLHKPNVPLDIFVSPSGLFDSLIVKIYTQAKCGQGHAGFTSGCMRTFGQHRAWGGSMEWRVQPWKECAAGDSVCIEWLTRVGTITYYPGFNCQDTMFTTQPILRYACR